MVLAATLLNLKSRFAPNGREDVIKIENGKKMGRPTTNPKNHVARLRLSESEHQKLMECCKLSNMSITDVLKLGIDKVYNSLQKK